MNKILQYLAMLILLGLIALAGELSLTLIVCLYVVVYLMESMALSIGATQGYWEGYLECLEKYKKDILKARGIEDVEKL